MSDESANRSDGGAENRGLSRSSASRVNDLSAAESTANGRPSLVKQSHGGALLAGGLPGNKGGGRPKDALRAKMRVALDAALDGILTALAGERLAPDAAKKLLDDERVQALGPDAVSIIAEVAREVLPATMTAKELIAAHESLAKYGVGMQQEIDKTETRRYVIALPSRGPANATNRVAPIATIPPPRPDRE